MSLHLMKFICIFMDKNLCFTVSFLQLTELWTCSKARKDTDPYGIADVPEDAELSLERASSDHPPVPCFLPAPFARSTCPQFTCMPTFWL